MTSRAGKSRAPVRTLRGLVVGALAAMGAWVLWPGAARTLLRVGPGGPEDPGGWLARATATRSAGLPSGVSPGSGGRSLRFQGGKYILDLDPNLRVPPILSLSAWVRFALPAVRQPLVAVEDENGEVSWLLVAERKDRACRLGGVVRDHFSQSNVCIDRGGWTAEPGRWWWVLVVADYRYGVYSFYVNGKRLDVQTMPAGPPGGGRWRRLWLGARPGRTESSDCEIRDLRFLAGKPPWRQRVMYVLTGRYDLGRLGWILDAIGLGLAGLAGWMFFRVSAQAARRFAWPGPEIRPSEVPRPRLGDFHHWIMAGLAVVGFVWVVAAFYPGAMSPDTIGQYQEGREWSFSDWHPPFLSAVMGLSDRLFHSPAPLLVVQAALYWGGFLGLAYSVRRRSLILAYALSMMGYWPAYLTLVGVLWKDVATAVAMLAATAMLFGSTAAGRRPGPLRTVGIVAALTVAVLVRGYSLLPALALAAWLVWLAFTGWPAKGRALRAAVVGAAAGVALLAGPAVATRILRPKRAHILQAILYHDLLGIEVRAKVPGLLHAYLRPGWTDEEMEKWYNPVCHDSATLGPTPPLRWLDDLSDLWRDWRLAVGRHPGAYLAHRWDVFAILMGLHDRPPNRHFREIEPNSFGFHLRNRPAGRAFDVYIQGVFLWVYAGWLYLAAAVGALAFVVTAWRVRGGWARLAPPETAALFLAATALLHFLPYFFLAPSRDFRYLYWGILAAGLAALLVAYELVRSAVRPGGAG